MATRLLLPAILVPIYSSQPIASREGTDAEKINCEKWLSTIGKWEGIICPACGNRTISQRYHTCGGKRYIDEDLNLYCEKCNDKTFFF